MAYRRLEAIYEYIEEDSPKNASLWVEKVLKKVASIKDFPKAGRAVPELSNAHVREIIFENYRIIYRIKNKHVFIMTVRHLKQILPLRELEE